MAWWKVLLFKSLLLHGTQSQSIACGVAPLNTKIVGGNEAVPGSWPWQVNMQSSSGVMCGASLISNSWVMSAAHCFQGNNDPTPWTLYLGLQSLTDTTNPNTVQRSVSRVIINPSYSSQTKNNDIALLQLASPVSFTLYISPVCLAASGSSFFNSTEAWVTGWGTLQSGANSPSTTLQEVEIPIVGNRKCNCLYGVGGISNNMMCAGLMAGGKDSCQGDSGGPLVVKTAGSVWVQAGIVSFGNRCALPNYPGVYTRVSNYQSWINSIITSNQPGFFTYTSSGTDGDLSVSCSGLPPVSTATLPPVVCGNAPLNTGGSSGSAAAGAWPWQVSLIRDGAHVCGASLISSSYIMTDAQCFTSLTSNSSGATSGWIVALGRLNQNGSNPYEVLAGVSNVVLSNMTGNNIALVQLNINVTMSSYIQSVCVDTGSNSYSIGTECWATGWGANQGGAQEVLQQLQTSVTSCVNVSSSGSICTTAMDLQQGYTGSPLVCKQGNSWYQAAVITLPNSTTKSIVNSTVEVFTKTSKFSGFITTNVKNLPSPTATATATTTATTNASPSSFSVRVTACLHILILPLSLVAHASLSSILIRI